VTQGQKKRDPTCVGYVVAQNKLVCKHVEKLVGCWLFMIAYSNCYQ